MILTLMKELAQEAAKLPAAESSGNPTAKFKCFICDKQSPKVEATATICAHLFHKGCLNGWFKYNHRCPQCSNQLKNREALAGQTPFRLNLGISALEAEKLKNIPPTESEILEKDLEEYLSAPSIEFEPPPAEGVLAPEVFEKTQSAPPPRPIQNQDNERSQSAPPLTLNTEELQIVEAEEPHESIEIAPASTIVLRTNQCYHRNVQSQSAQ